MSHGFGTCKNCHYTMNVKNLVPDPNPSHRSTGWVCRFPKKCERNKNWKPSAPYKTGPSPIEVEQAFERAMRQT